MMHVSERDRTRADGIESDGVMRLDECQQVQKDLSEALGINLTVVDAAQRFLEGLKGVEDPEVAPPLRTSVSFFPLTSPAEKAQVHRYVRPGLDATLR